MSQNYYKIVTAKAPVNIALIKYWGKSNEKLKTPINDSISGTLDIDEMCATTSVAISSNYDSDEFWLNGEKQNLSNGSSARLLIEEIKKLSNYDKKILDYKIHISSFNNFPTAAGLASSAAGYACLAYVVGHAYGVVDSCELSKLARIGSGSACRSLFGGFVQWVKGQDHDSSKAIQIVDHDYWPEMRVVICVINEKQKDVSSSAGMSRSVKTSELIRYRADTVVPARIEEMKSAIIDKNFDKFANLTMQDSNQFHAICLDSFPPIFYLNETSRQIIKICSVINSHYAHNKVAYTYDAGPNACIYLLEEFVPKFLYLMQTFFRKSGGDGQSSELEIKGKKYSSAIDQDEMDLLCAKLRSHGLDCQLDTVTYLISTSIGSGPVISNEHIKDKNLQA